MSIRVAVLSLMVGMVGVGCKSTDDQQTGEVGQMPDPGALTPPSAIAGSGMPALGGAAAAAGMGGTAGSGGAAAPVGGAGMGGIAETPRDGAGVPTAGGTGGVGGSMTPPATASCSGKAGAKRGKSTQTLMVGGLMRRFEMYAPASLDAAKPAPLVIVPHGFTMSGQAMFEITGYDKIADREGFVVLYPDGQGAFPWNVGVGVCGIGAVVSAPGDDQAFVNAMIDFVEADQCLDRAHIFMSGFSMGGYFSNETGCLNGQIRAIGPHSGGSHPLTACKNTKMPAIIFHGDADPLIAPLCGTGARDSWAARNGCMPASAGVDTTMVKAGRCEYNKGCPAGAQVALCTFTGMGHGWAGGVVGRSPGANYAFPAFESASELGWAFFKKHAW